VSLILGAVGVALLHQAGRAKLAVGAAWALIGAVFLPPAVGFALFFGLLHSPDISARVSRCFPGVVHVSGAAW
jgi:hypothetical protein